MKEICDNSKKNPLLSVICITYNHEDYIDDCLNGLTMQETNFPFEVLIHDDASTDGTLDIIKQKIKERPDLFRLFTEEDNQYQKVDIVHNMIKQSQGTYVAFCEGDDYWIDPFKLQRQVNLFQKNPGMTLCFSNRFIKNEQSGISNIMKWKNRVYTQEDFFSGFNPGIQTECFLKSSLTDEELEYGFENRINGDRSIPIISLNHGWALNIPVVTSVYRVTGKGVSTSIAANNTTTFWFNHATDDLYHLHESYKFPSLKAYIKSITAYTFNFIRKSGKFIYGINKVSRYGSQPRLLMIIRVCWAEFKYLLGRLFHYIIKLCRKIYIAFQSRIVSHQFSSIVFECNGDLFDIKKMQRVKSFNTPRINIGNKSVTIADAFLYSDGEKMSLFYELQNSFNAKGVLMKTSTVDNVNWTEPDIALEESFHLSFPNVFDLDGETWMIPETFMSGQVRLYKENKTTGQFNLHNILLEGSKYVDSFIFKKENTYYLFTSIQYDDQSYDLKLFYSDCLNDGYVEHPMSPISHGKAFQRNAGRLVEKDGRLFRPAQECTDFYGQNVHILEVIELSRTYYKEVPIHLDIIPSGKRFGVGGHQFSSCVFKGKRYVAVDILHKSFNTHIIKYRLIRKIKGR